MKKHVLVLVVAILFISYVKGQECVYCPQEPISPTASNIGPYTEAAGSSSIAMGIYSTTTSNASNSFAMGVFVKSTIPYNFVIGTGVNSSNYLVNNIQRSLMIGFGSTKPTFFVSTSPTPFTTGRIGIGDVTAPQAKLHIRADEEEDAVLLLEPTGGGQTAQVRFGTDNSINARQGGHMHFETADDKAFVFHQGDIYLEDIQSGIIMKSPNGQCWRGTLTDQGMLNFVLTDCPDLVSIPQVVQQTTRLQVFPNPAKNSISIKTSPENRSGRLLLMATDGTELRSTTITADITELSLEGLPAGTYMIRLEHNGSVVESVKVVKQ